MVAALVTMVVAVIAVVAGVLRAGSWSEASASGDGPLRTASDAGGTWCVPRFVPGGGVAHGSEVLDNTSDEEVRITDVSLVDHQGFEIVGTYGRDLTGTATGVLPQWPPPRAKSLYELTSVAPGARFNLVLHLRSLSEASKATLTAVRLDYEQDGRYHYTMTNHSVDWKTKC